jgi:F0F1-type ATP synthase membrane subunit b/b'
MEHHFDFTNAVGIPYFNFLVFILLFVVFFRKTLASMANSRRENFLSASKEAATALDAARAGFEDVKKRFDGLEADLNQFKQQSESQALQESKRLLDETERFTKQLKEETNRLAGDAVAQARQQLRLEIIQGAKTMAAAKIQADLDTQSKNNILKSRITDASVLTVQ